MTVFEVVPLASREHSWHATYSEENEIAFYRLTRHPLVPLQILIYRFKRSCSRVSLISSASHLPTFTPC